MSRFTRSVAQLRVGNRRGATTVEFAFAATILFTLTLGSVELSRMNMIRNTSENAAYEATRAVVIPGAETDDASDLAVSLLRLAGIKQAQIDVSPSVITQDTESVTVDISVPLDGNCWLPPIFLGNRVVTSSCTLHRSWITNAAKNPLKKDKSKKTTYLNDATAPGL
jgi:hypothetical protein